MKPATSAERRANKRMGQRMEAWLFDVRRRPALERLIRGLEIVGRRKAAGVLDDAERVAIGPTAARTWARPVEKAPEARAVVPACLSFEPCHGTGERWYTAWDAEAGRVRPRRIYCWCEAGERLRLADGVRSGTEERLLPALPTTGPEPGDGV